MSSENNQPVEANFVDAGYTFKVNEGNTYNQYNLQSHNIYDKGINTNDQIIRYNGKHIRTLKQTYKVVPHEDLIKLVRVATDEMGLKNVQNPKLMFGSIQGRGFQQQRWGQSAKFGDAIISPDGKYISASFVSEEVKIGDVNNSHNIFGGVTIMGSIDGTTAIRVMPLTLRTFCFNIMNHVLAEVGIKNLLGEATHQLNKLQKMDSVQENRKIQARFYHSQKLEMVDVVDSIKAAISKSQEILGEYKKLQDLMLKQKMALALVEKMPAASIKSADFLELTKDGVVITNPNISLYEVMNHFTNFLTFHSMTKSMKSVFRKYGEVDSIFFNENRRMELLAPEVQ